LSHYYQEPEIQDIADFVGDSLALAQWAAKTLADIIVLCGVHFMGETAKILSPQKRVFIPDTAAGCSLADSCPADEFKKFIEEHPDHTVISYVNTTAAVKALTDIVVTSTNARQIVESLPVEEKIIFGPDRNLGDYINKLTGRNMLLWNGYCHVHQQFSMDKILELKKRISRKLCCLASSRMSKLSASNSRSHWLYFFFIEICNSVRQKTIYSSNRGRDFAPDAKRQSRQTVYSCTSPKIQHALATNVSI